MRKYVTFGEIMLRLKSPGHERFFQSPSFEATFGGGESNVAVALANYGFDAAFVTALPDNDIAEACLREVRSFGVDVSGIRRSGDRLGIYFLETGAVQRGSKVIYDRAGSALATIETGMVEVRAAELAVQSADMATEEDLRRVHPASYLSEFKRLSDAGGGELGLRAPFSRGGYEIAALSAGDFVHRDEQCVVIRDIDPKAPVHLLVIPVKPLVGIQGAGVEDQLLLGHLLLTARQMAVKNDLTRMLPLNEGNASAFGEYFSGEFYSFSRMGSAATSVTRGWGAYASWRVWIVTSRAVGA